ncbi:MAG: hypothetical protein HY667_06810 [Chloroflexi bacterium]|nr:hypothetical protein [Chloroflexota bacterium]
MITNKANGQYEVLSPWAEADPIPIRGITPRPVDLAGKKIGLLANNKRAAPPILDVVERELKKRFPTVEFSRYRGKTFSVSHFEQERVAEFEEWIKGVDAVVAAVGD